MGLPSMYAAIHATLARNNPAHGIRILAIGSAMSAIDRAKNSK